MIRNGSGPTYALSIDVGTTYTAAAVWRDGRATTIPLGDHSDAIPSVLYLREDNVFLVGDSANRRATTDPSRVAREFKRRMGDPVPQIIGGQKFFATDLTAHLVGWVLEQVTRQEGAAPHYVTLTCPASWEAHRRTKLLEAANRAGLDTAGLSDVGLMPEPDAAATHYAAQNRLAPGTTVAVYDLGGGTFDAAVLRKTSSGFELCGQAGGIDWIGGVDFDSAIMDLITAEIGESISLWDPDDPAVATALARLRSDAVMAKEALSTDSDVEVQITLPGDGRLVRLTRGAFEDSIHNAVEQTVSRFRQVIESSGVADSEIASILLVGGSSRIPLIGQLLHNEMGVPILRDAHPKHAVCLGAAVAVATRVPRPNPPHPLAAPAPEPIVAPAQPGPTPNSSAADSERPQHLSTQTQVIVDLATAGLTTPPDSRMPLHPQDRPRLQVTDRDQPLTVRLDELKTTTNHPLRLLALMIAAIAILVVVVLLARLR